MEDKIDNTDLFTQHLRDIQRVFKSVTVDLYVTYKTPTVTGGVFLYEIPVSELQKVRTEICKVARELGILQFDIDVTGRSSS